MMGPATSWSGNTAAVDHQQSSRAALGDLLRALLLLKPGRFKQSGETLAQRAEQVLQRIESDGALKKETAGFPDQLKAVTNELNRFRSLNVGRPSPEQQESMLQVEARVEALRLDLDRQLQVLEERSAPRLLKS